MTVASSKRCGSGESEGIGLSEYLSVRPALVVMVERDPRYARRLVSEAISNNQIPHSLVLEWSGTRGWIGSAELLSRSGIAQAGGVGVSPDPVSGIHQLTGTLRASRERSGEGRVPMLKGGLVALYDLDSERDQPALLRALGDLSDVLSSISGSAVLLLSKPLPEAHPLYAASVQLHCPPSPQKRYGEMVDSFLRRLGSKSEAEAAAEVSQVLDGLPLVAADFILRLAWSTIVRDEDGRGQRRVAERVRAIRGVYEKSSGAT